LGNIARLLIISILLKISYLVFAYFIPGSSSVSSIGDYSSIIKRNDSGWYEKIAVSWYPKIQDKKELGYNNGADFKQSEWAFFPFYPWINRALMKSLNAGFNLSGFIYSILFSSFALIGFYLFCRLYLNEINRAYYYSLVFLLFPFHYYYSMMYTEAVYFTFLIFSFISIYKRKYAYIPLLIIPLVLVRPNGIIGLIPLYLYFLERKDIVSKKRIDLKLLFGRKIVLQSLLFLTGPIAFILFGIYQKQMTGYFFAFNLAQAGWYREFMFPLLAFFRRGDFTTQFNSVYSILAILLAVVSWKKFPLSLNIFIWAGLLLPLCSGSVASMPRFISVIFPFTMIIGGWLYPTRFKYPVLGLFFLLQIFVFYYWLTGNPFSC
jgi:hypothetical protein